MLKISPFKVVKNILPLFYGFARRQVSWDDIYMSWRISSSRNALVLAKDCVEEILEARLTNIGN